MHVDIKVTSIKQPQSSCPCKSAKQKIYELGYALLTQKGVSDDMGMIRKIAPKTWQYLMKHAALLDKRKSIIYDKRPRFSTFGIGAYTFAPWKVAISGLYKNISFVEIAKYKKKPIVVMIPAISFHVTPKKRQTLLPIC